MRKVGRLLHRTPRGLVARLESPQKLGEVLLVKGKGEVGRIQDLFGPVSSPYALLRPHKALGEKELGALLGKELYVEVRK
ncbi:MAG: Gar1/Naf1 family protein [Candidatus Hadarchaeales archaeon]